MQFRHHDIGGTAGPLLLMLHGNGFLGRTFLPMARVLSGSFRCIALDFPGHGTAAADGELIPYDLKPNQLIEACYQYIVSMGFQGQCMGFMHGIPLSVHGNPVACLVIYLYISLIGTPHAGHYYSESLIPSWSYC